MVAPGWISMPVFGVGMLLHDAWEQRNATLQHRMRKAVRGEYANAWIAEHDLVNVPSCGVSIVGRLHVKAQLITNSRQHMHDGISCFVGLRS